MSVVFSFKGYTGQTFHWAHSAKPLEIRGHYFAHGPQPVKDSGGVPQWVADLFAEAPDVTQVAINTKTGGVVWSRHE